MSAKTFQAVTMGIVLSAFLTGCGDKQAQNTQPTTTTQTSMQDTMKAAATAASDVAAKAQQTAASAQQAAANAQQAAQQQAPATPQVAQVSDEIKTWLAKAQELLTSQNYNEAIQYAQKALAQDPTSTQAKGIIAQAQEAIQKLAAQNMPKLNTAVTGLQNKIPGMGQ